ncbi:cbb3-type cytochrome oxidase assembly protein CcoS [Roseovarius aestuariivivens]|uniref:cbb3-type cytochrome oxidase assembly protein CcoS n=1 Tax=Roseovarius aestuariivivens TaxID=1888910 RepID=UPI0010817127|nr:cbb3-type cytochrome oxidase assembly protein CcoS [Roseovarius aestuariivivens]
MTMLAYLIPISLVLGGFGLGFFIWTVKTNQYDDPDGDARRILSGDYDDRPKT